MNWSTAGISAAGVGQRAVEGMFAGKERGLSGSVGLKVESSPHTLFEDTGIGQRAKRTRAVVTIRIEHDVSIVGQNFEARMQLGGAVAKSSQSADWNRLLPAPECKAQ